MPPIATTVSRSLAIFLLLGSVGVETAVAVCVSPTGAAFDGSPCATTIQAAITGSPPGDAVLLYPGTYAEWDLDLCTGGPPCRSLLAAPDAFPAPVIDGTAAPMHSITVIASAPTAVTGVEIRSGRPNAVGLEVRNTSSPRVTLRDVHVIAQGYSSVGIRVTNVGQGGGAGAYWNNVRASTRFATATTIAFQLDTLDEFECKDCIFTADDGIAFDLVTAPSLVANFDGGQIRVGGKAIGLRRSTCGNIRLHGTTFFSLEPPGTGKACGAGGVCFVSEGSTCTSRLSLPATGFQDDSCRSQFVNAPKVDGSHWRGSCPPFSCPSTFPGEVLGSHWFDRATGQDKVCTSAGWKPILFQ